MASVVTYDGGLRRVEFSLVPNGPRKAVRLGRISAKAAQTFATRLESIISDQTLGQPHDAETVAWLTSRGDATLRKLRAVGLAVGVGTAAVTLGAFLKQLFGALAVKPQTAVAYGQTRRNLEGYFTADRPLRGITPADADGWRAWLVEHEELSAATVARRVIAARTFWRRAVRWRMATENPFEGVRAGHQANESRKHFVSRATIEAALKAAPDAEWRAIIALARYGGLRTPSETFALRWADIDWERGTVRVTCPKLAHIEGCAQRIIPLFPELRDVLSACLLEAPDGAEHVISRHRLGGMNLRTYFLRIIDKAKLTVWPRLFHNLRASRESELMREYDLATVCRWIGNSPAVAATHYATSIDLNADFKRAAAVPTEAQQNAQQSASVHAGQRDTANPAEAAEVPANKGADTDSPSVSDAVETELVGAVGFEPT